MLARMNGLRVANEDGSSNLCEHINDVPSNVTMPTMEQIQDRGKGDSITKTITIVQTLWFAVQAAHRVSQGLTVTELELTTLGHVVLNILIYWCWWNKPLNLRFPVDVYPKKREEITEQSSNEQHAAEPGPQGPTSPRKLSIRVRVGAYLNRNINDWDGSWKATILVIGFFIIGGTFGAIHCLAWNSAFPTHVEHLLWRVSALVVTTAPGLIFALALIPDESDMAEDLTAVVGMSLILVYCLGRACLLALALAALRALPERAYEMPS